MANGEPVNHPLSSLMGYDNLHGDKLVKKISSLFNLDIMEPELFDNWPAAVNRLITLWWGTDGYSLRDLTVGADIRVKEGNDYAGTRILVYNYAGGANTLEAILVDQGYGFDTTASAVTATNYTRDCEGGVGDRVAVIKDWRIINKLQQSVMNDRRHSRYARLCRGLGDASYQQWESAPDEGAPAAEGEGGMQEVPGRVVGEDAPPEDHRGVEMLAEAAASASETEAICPIAQPLRIGVGRHADARWDPVPRPLICKHIPRADGGYDNCDLNAYHPGDHRVELASRRSGEPEVQWIPRGRTDLVDPPSDGSTGEEISPAPSAAARAGARQARVPRRPRGGGGSGSGTARAPPPYRHGVNGLRSHTKAELLALRAEVDRELVHREVEAKINQAKEDTERAFKRRFDELEAKDKEREGKAKAREDEAAAKVEAAEVVRVKAQKRMDALAPLKLAFQALANPDDDDDE